MESANPIYGILYTSFLLKLKNIRNTVWLRYCDCFATKNCACGEHAYYQQNNPCSSHATVRPELYENQPCCQALTVNYEIYKKRRNVWISGDRAIGLRINTPQAELNKNYT